MCVFLGVPEIAEDPNFQPSGLLRENVTRTKAVFATKVKERERVELFESAGGWHLPVSLVATTKEILESPQHEAQGFFQIVDHPLMGKVNTPGAPFKMTETPWQLKSAVPERNHRQRR